MEVHLRDPEQERTASERLERATLALRRLAVELRRALEDSSDPADVVAAFDERLADAQAEYASAVVEREQVGT